jgi:isoleucyl-tRNA synthetase
LEAKVILNLSLSLKKLLEKYEEELEAFFIVSKVELRDSLKEEVMVKVERVEEGKCERCWNYKESVGRDKEFPTLCERCLIVVKGNYL